MGDIFAVLIRISLAEVKWSIFSICVLRFVYIYMLSICVPTLEKIPFFMELTLVIEFYVLFRILREMLLYLHIISECG